MRRLRGVKSAVHDAVDHVVDLVELGQASTARAVLRAMPAELRGPAVVVDSVRRVFTTGVHMTIKGVNRAVEHVSDIGLDLAYPDGDLPPPLPLRSDLIGTAEWLADAAIGAANGVGGDHLRREVPGGASRTLDLGMRLRTSDRWLGHGGDPGAVSGKIVLLVHGLATTEWSWCLDSARYNQDPSVTMGTRLQEDFGFTPVYARYNSGRHISENGRALAAQITRLCADWPVPVAEIVLLGHSMGGLVIRSACSIALAEDQAWIDRVHRVITLASPLQGAPLERFGSAVTRGLAAVDLPGTLITASLINSRSAGIKDLRYGYVQDAEWQGLDPDLWAVDSRQSVRLPPHIAWCFVSATLGAGADDVLSQALGDLLVRVESASGPAEPPERRVTHHVGGLHHVAIQVHPSVYAVIRQFLT